MAYGMLIDMEKCVGCHACSLVCKASHGTPEGAMRSKVIRLTEGSYPNVVRTIIPTLCNQCENPPCVGVCPQDATYKREEDGIVVIDAEKCIGCGMCVKACPYEARHILEKEITYCFGEEETLYEEVMYAKLTPGTADKCDFCLSRAADGETPTPTCVQACPTVARVFGDLDAMKLTAQERNGYTLLPEEGTNPSVRYLPLVAPNLES